MRVRNVGIAAAAGLALAAGLAVGGEAQGGAAGSVREEPVASDLRVDARPLHGLTVADARRPSGPRGDGMRVALLKVRAVPGTVRRVQTVSGGDGRLSWAVRSFERPRVTGGIARDVRIDPSRPGIRCAQLGRVRGAAFGWVLPSTGTFRPLGAEVDLQALCATDVHGSGLASRSLLIPDRDPYDRDARLRAAVVWGIAPAAARRVRVTWSGWSRIVPVRDGTFVAVGPPPTGPFVDRDARVVVPGSAADRPRPKRRGRPRVWRPATADRARIAGRLIDPSTGRPSAVVVGTAGGRPCDGGVAPVVAGVVGSVDPALQVVGGAGRECQVLPTLRRGQPPMVTAYGGGIGGSGQDGPDLVDRERLVPGGYQVTILTPPDVVRLELRSAGDVRTVRPVAPGIVHALYDGAALSNGDFTGSGVEAIGIRADGSRVRATGPSGPEGVRLGSAELGGP
ncbi:hypothetical protein AB0L40_10875 [Patulibacter sp. NPDC049589]|uniref:hypothetical protein n=1 Tax=Patulibacter sp. NPDC049589 TaxID=3154731 RepID=UPI003417D004